MVATRRRSPAAGSLRRLQWRVRFHLWTEISARKRFIPANGDRSLTPNLEPVPPKSLHTRFKTACAKADTKMVVEVMNFIKRRTVALEQEK
jgi:hypothetical protein